MSSPRSVVSSAKLIAGCTLLSRITGLARDVLLARALGLGWIQDAFQYAFLIPNLFRRLLGEGAMAAAFVPTFTRTLETEGRPAGWQLLARTLALLTVVLAAVIMLIGLVILIVWFARPGSALVLALSAIMLPFMLSVCVLALFSSILNCVGSFVPAALMPVMLNLSMIVATALVGPLLYPGRPGSQAYVIAVSVLLAGGLQILIMLPILRRYGVQLGWRLDVHDPAVRGMFRLLAPVLLGQGVLAFGVFLDGQICLLLTHKTGTSPTFTLAGQTIEYPLAEGALAAVTYAQRLYQFPLGVLVLSLATAALPAFSRLAARKDWNAWGDEVRQAFRLSIFEGVLAGAMIIVLAAPIFRLLFEYGRVSPQDTQRAAHVLVFYGFGLWAFCAQHIVLRGFYSAHDVRTPLLISVVLLPVNVLLNVLLVWVEGIREAAFAISTTTTFTASVIVGVVILQRKIGTRVVTLSTAWALLRMLLAAGLAALVVRLAQPHWSGWTLQIDVVVLARAAETFGLLALGTAVFLVVAWMLRLREVRLLLARRDR